MADPRSDGSGPAAPGDFSSLIDQLVQTPAATALTTPAPAAIAAQPGAAVPTPAVVAFPSPPGASAPAAMVVPASTPRSATSGPVSEKQSDTETEDRTPAPVASADAASPAQVAVAPLPVPPPPSPQPVPLLPMTFGAAPSTEPAAQTATVTAAPGSSAKVLPTDATPAPTPGDATDDVSQRPAAAPARAADQRTVATQARLTGQAEQDFDDSAPATTADRPATTKKSAGSPPLPDAAPAALPQAAPDAAAYAPIAAPATTSTATPRVTASGSRQTQSADAVLTPTVLPIKTTALDTLPPAPIGPEQATPLITVTTPAPTTAASAVEVRQAPAAPPTPATQIAQAIVEPVRVVMAKPDHDPAVPHVTTIQITPVELGRVEVRIERPAEGPAKIQLVAERADTLSRLVQDQSQLSQALDGAGLPQHGRIIEFSLAPQTAGSDAFASQFSNGGNAAGGNSSGGFSQGRSGRYPEGDYQFSDDAAAISAATSRALRSGIDITA